MTAIYGDAMLIVDVVNTALSAYNFVHNMREGSITMEAITMKKHENTSKKSDLNKQERALLTDASRFHHIVMENFSPNSEETDRVCSEATKRTLEKYGI